MPPCRASLVSELCFLQLSDLLDKNKKSEPFANRLQVRISPIWKGRAKKIPTFSSAFGVYHPCDGNSITPRRRPYHPRAGQHISWGRRLYHLLGTPMRFYVIHAHVPHREARKRSCNTARLFTQHVLQRIGIQDLNGGRDVGKNPVCLQLFQLPVKRGARDVHDHCPIGY